MHGLLFESPQNLIRFIVQRPASDFKTLDFSKVCFKQAKQLDYAKLSQKLEKMQLVCYREPCDVSFLTHLNPTSIQELKLDFSKTQYGFWKEIHEFSSLRKLEVNLYGNVKGPELRVDQLGAD